MALFDRLKNVGGGSLRQAFADNRADCLKLWRESVRLHAEQPRRKVDLAALVQAAPMIGIRPDAVPAAFDHDVQQWQEYREHLAAEATDKASMIAAGKAAVGVEDEIQRLHDELTAAIQRRDAVRWTAESLAHASARVHAFRRKAPRLFGEVVAAAAAAESEPFGVTVDEGDSGETEPAPIPVGATLGDGAEWIADD